MVHTGTYMQTMAKDKKQYNDTVKQKIELN
jgi:hypothetical protein